MTEGTLPRNTRQTRRALQQLRSGIEQGQVAGYRDAGDVPRPFPGDEESPWSKNPPFPSEATLWQAVTLEAANECTLLSPLDVSYYRVLAAFFDYTPADEVTGQLSIVPEVWNETQEAWYATAVVDPTLTPDVVICTLPGYGARSFYGTEMRVGTPGVPVRIVLPFDVTAYTRWRFRLRDLSPAGEGNDPGDVRVYYALSL